MGKYIHILVKDKTVTAFGQVNIDNKPCYGKYRSFNRYNAREAAAFIKNAACVCEKNRGQLRNWLTIPLYCGICRPMPIKCLSISITASPYT